MKNKTNIPIEYTLPNFNFKTNAVMLIFIHDFSHILIKYF